VKSRVGKVVVNVQSRLLSNLRANLFNHVGHELPALLRPPHTAFAGFGAKPMLLLNTGRLYDRNRGGFQSAFGSAKGSKKSTQ
jgi:hypothetical protein